MNAQQTGEVKQKCNKILIQSKELKSSQQSLKKVNKIFNKRKKQNCQIQSFQNLPKFRRPQRSLKTLQRQPKYLRRSVAAHNTWDRYAILQAPCTSERFYKKMKTENIMIFFVDPQANKTEIKNSFKEAFNIQPERVNTLLTVSGKKKAYIKVPKSHEAYEVANKMGLI